MLRTSITILIIIIAFLLPGLLASCDAGGEKTANAATIPALLMPDVTADVSKLDSRAARLARSIEEPLRGELLALLRDGRKIPAIKRYREASGEGLRTAKSVIDILDAGGDADAPSTETSR